MTRLGFHALSVGALIALAGIPAAQGRHVFAIDQAQSSFTYSGSIVYLGIPGNIVGQPATFNVSGAQEADLTVSSGVLTTGQLLAGRTVVTVPTLNAIVPNAFPFLPPLATMQVTGVTMVFTSGSFPVAGTGAFNTSVTASLLSGSAVLTALGTTQTIPLAGNSSPPQAISGTLTSRPDGFRLQVALNTTFSFMDPTTGANGTLNLVGNIQADDLGLATDVDTISLSTGGTQTFTLSAGTAQAGRLHLLLGSFTGTLPGLNLGAVTLPLNPDSYLTTTAVAPNVPPLGNTLAVLDGLGTSTATFTIPPLNIPALTGIQFNHAYLVISGPNFVFASNPATLNFTN